MPDTRRSFHRRWLLVAVGVAVTLYGIVGFPTPNDPDPEVALADRQRTCYDVFWNQPVDPPICVKIPHVHEEVCSPSQHRHGVGLQCHSATGCHNGQHRHGSGCHDPGTEHSPPPTTTTTIRTTASNNQGGSNNRLGGGTSGSKDTSTKKQCGQNQELKNNKCEFVYSSNAPCPTGTERDATSKLCITIGPTRDRCAAQGFDYDPTLMVCINRDTREAQPTKDLDVTPAKDRACLDRRQWWVADADGRGNPGCRVKLRADDPERSKYCPGGQVFYSTLGCRYPCDAGQTVVNGRCVTIVQVTQRQQTPQTPQNPQQPQTPQQPKQPAVCPVGYTGTPPNCQETPAPTAHVSIDGDAVVDENVGSVTVTVTLSRPATRRATVVLSTTDGAAVAGTDYTALTTQTGTISFAAGEQQKQLPPISVLDDDIHEPDEKFTVSVSSASGGAQVPSDGSSVEFTIIDDDPPPRAVRNFTAECGPDDNGRMHVRLLWEAPDPPGVWSTDFKQYQVVVGGSPADQWLQFNVSWTEARNDGGVNLSTNRNAKQVRDRFKAGDLVYATVTPGTPVQRSRNGITYEDHDFGRNLPRAASAICPKLPNDEPENEQPEIGDGTPIYR